MTDKRISQIISEQVSMLLSENDQTEGTDKQNAYLKKLMGDRWKEEYSNLSTQETSAMIDKELGKTPGHPAGYEVVDTVVEGGPEIIPCRTFPEARKKLDEVIGEYYDVGFFQSSDLRFIKESDVMYSVYGRNSRHCYGKIYIRKKK